MSEIKNKTLDLSWMDCKETFSYDDVIIKIPSLNGQYIIDWESINNVKNQLVDQGWYVVGSGEYSNVFLTEYKNYAIKVSVNDYANYLWIKYCLNHQENKFIPKIYSTFTVSNNKISKYSSFYNIIVMEILNKNDSEWNKTYQEIKKNEDEELKKIWTDLIYIKDNHGFTVDIAAANCLFSEVKGSIVFNDPVCP
jgi:hypothetical protein